MVESSSLQHAIMSYRKRIKRFSDDDKAFEEIETSIENAIVAAIEENSRYVEVEWARFIKQCERKSLPVSGQNLMVNVVLAKRAAASPDVVRLHIEEAEDQAKENMKAIERLRSIFVGAKWGPEPGELDGLPARYKVFKLARPFLDAAEDFILECTGVGNRALAALAGGRQYMSPEAELLRFKLHLLGYIELDAQIIPFSLVSCLADVLFPKEEEGELVIYNDPASLRRAWQREKVHRGDL